MTFRATLAVDGTRGVFTGSGGPTTTIATSGGTYSSFISTEINDEGTVVFDANRAVGGMVLVTARDGTLTPFVDTDGPFSQFFAGRLSINNQGTVVFGADLDAGGHGIFQGPDPIADKIIAMGDPLDGSTVAGFPDNYLNPRGLNNAGQLIFRVDLADGRRVLVRADPIRVARTDVHVVAPVYGPGQQHGLSSYSFTPIADTGPNSPYSGLDRPAINNLGAVAFEANLRSGGAGIFTRNADGSQGPIIAITSDLIRTFTLSPFMNDSGKVSFGAELRDGRTAIFTGRSQELTRIADTEPDSPFSSLPSPAPRIQNDGTVTFHGTLRSGGTGLFAGNGGLPGIFYVTGGQFSAFLGGPASQLNGHTLAFRATLQDGRGGEFTGSGGPTTTIATTGPVFSSFIGGEINDAGTLAISANLTTGGQAIVVAQDGTLRTFVDTTGAYSQFFAGQVSINNAGQIVFAADVAAGGHGIFQGPDAVADKILATRDELFGSTVVAFPANAPGVRGLNNAGQIAFSANLADGRTVLVRADPIRVVRRDYFVDITSTLPHYYGLPAQLDVHEVAPFYFPGQQHKPTQAAILVHGRTIDAVTGFDLQYQDYSLQESMARAGIDTFAVNFLGWGLSTHFGLDDPRNASLSDQQAYLIPNPLSQTAANPDPFHFTNTQAMVDQLDAVVNDVRDRLGVDKVSLSAWSRGGLVVGPYIYLHPEKVKNVVFEAGSYNFPANPPDPLPQPGPSLIVQDRAHVEASWTGQVDNVAFPGQQDPAILDLIWQSIMARDLLGSTWGTNGLQRFPSADYWGWNPDQHQASRVTVPALVLTGLLDTMVLPATEVQLYNDLGSEKKVLIKVDGASHFMLWEGSTSPTWNGPHATLQDAVVQWITSETYRGSTTGTFHVHADGSIEEGPAKVASVVINDGSAQRSRVASLTVTFSGVVTLDPGAFELLRQGGGLVGLNVATSAVDGRTVAVLTFTGADIVGGSLADGNYTLTIRGDRIHDLLDQELDGDGDGLAGGNRLDDFFRLFGDSDGDRDVDAWDLFRFLGTLGRRAGQTGFLDYFDFDGDNDVDLIDSLAFFRRIGTYLRP